LRDKRKVMSHLKTNWFSDAKEEKITGPCRTFNDNLVLLHEATLLQQLQQEKTLWLTPNKNKTHSILQ